MAPNFILFSFYVIYLLNIRFNLAEANNNVDVVVGDNERVKEDKTRRALSSLRPHRYGIASTSQLQVISVDAFGCLKTGKKKMKPTTLRVYVLATLLDIIRYCFVHYELKSVDFMCTFITTGNSGTVCVWTVWAPHCARIAYGKLLNVIKLFSCCFVARPPSCSEFARPQFPSTIHTHTPFLPCSIVVCPFCNAVHFSSLYIASWEKHGARVVIAGNAINMRIIKGKRGLYRGTPLLHSEFIEVDLVVDGGGGANANGERKKSGQNENGKDFRWKSTPNYLGNWSDARCFSRK